MIKFDVITIFPEIFDSYLKEGLIARAQEKKLMQIKIHNLRKWTKDRHQTVDDRPYGGGLGMVLKVEPIFKAVSSLTKLKLQKKKLKSKNKNSKIIVFTPRGKQFNQKIAQNISQLDQVIMICGRYEGIDERVTNYLADLKISIGPYDLMGGELPAMITIEAVARLIPGVIGKEQLLKERITKSKGFVEYQQYSRPEVFEPKPGLKWRVPKVLLSGNHKKIEQWRKKYLKVIE